MRPTLRLLNAARAAQRPPLTLGFIGLGQMGLNMADNLFTRTAKAYAEDSTTESSQPPLFLVCDVNTATAESFARGMSTRFPNVVIQVAESPANLAQRAQTVFTMLPSSPQVKDVYLGDRGILQGISNRPERIDSLCIDSTTLDVDVAKDVAAQVEATGTDMVDAPVSGGVVGARAGTLSFMVGGSEEAYNKAQPFLANMGRTIVHCGASGSGLTAKICNNLVLGIQQIAVAEAMLLGTSLGLDPGLLAGVLNTSTGRCWSSEVNNPVPGALPGKSPPCEKEYHGKCGLSRVAWILTPEHVDAQAGSRLDSCKRSARMPAYSHCSPVLLPQDMALAQHAASTVSTPLPLGDAATSIYKAMNQSEGQKFADKDFSVVYEYLRQQTRKQV